MKNTADIFKALSDPTRLKILSIIYYADVCICDIVEFLGFSYPTITQHLKILQEIGLIKLTKNNKFQICSFNKSSKDKRFNLIIQNFDLLFKAYKLTKAEIKKLNDIVAKRVCNIK
ncbi:MAG TPA: metalloregulator ArsR/SmtB family transcription factor [Ignavibacteriales bacterium]|mgnify:CR=1 FL=1|nr:metalloregulator ArsR/SmtB family transcription factor [Ignavibacteriales bacterium]HOL81475.1 metalloregulator ArsR/SmtB family transcription factor [Ignavibacteriales bacterium]HOM65373.1 metalloregulator ArsR/SmtB family transcription factor [Ignavibacteriales bacterium]HPD67002.1 metalloregulator ArsR/SmtB family transcription factor [Ignavibacteriales bacterium]HRR18838.1 metalloregulator ArsR/SmtB family transcription factor [Ignavibacteriales bacterium]